MARTEAVGQHRRLDAPRKARQADGFRDKRDGERSGDERQGQQHRKEEINRQKEGQRQRENRQTQKEVQVQTQKRDTYHTYTDGVRHTQETEISRDDKETAERDMYPESGVQAHEEKAERCMQ